MSPHGLLAIPEAANRSDPRALQGDELVVRVLEIADEQARQQPIDWEEDLSHGGGPCLALGAERRSRPR